MKLLQIVCKHGVLLITVDEGLPPHQLVVLACALGEQVSDGRVIGQHQSAHAVGGLDVRAFPGERNLDGGWSPLDEVRQPPLADALQGVVHLGRVYVPLNDVEDGYVLAVAGFFAPCVGADHDVLGLEQPPHHVQDGGFPHGRCGLPFHAQRGVSRHEEVASWSWDQPRHKPDQIVVHVSRIPEGGGRSSHNGADERVGLREGRVWDAQSFHGDAIECGVVQHYHGIRIECQSLECEQAVVRLHDHIARFLLVGEHAVRLHQFLPVSVVERFK
mmetsp:Transcript_2101/g.13649  ORF Transcript_2101/g.13649 Transcript_2101/m.13649 type:complete len:273 (+) Transcript_2101:3153-3971(+)